MKIAVLGGSFNPLHNGHVLLAQKVLLTFKYDKIFFVPTFVPPHKEIVKGVSAFHRLEMIKEFCRNKNDYFVAEDCEIKRGGISYTYDTLCYLCKKYSDGIEKIEGKIGLIMGEEIAAEFHKWKNPQGICDLAELIIVPRECDYEKNKSELTKNKPSGNYKGDFSENFDKEKFSYPYKMLDNPVACVSSPEIRNRIMSGKPFDDLVPAEIYEYIVKNGLYL